MGNETGYARDMTGDPSENDLSPEQLEDWAALATLLERLPAALDAQLQRDSGLSHYEHGILFALGSAPDGSLRMSTLAGYAHSTLSRLSRAVTRLERQGLVRREEDPSDGRASLAALTADGFAALDQSLPGHRALVRKVVLDPLTDSQLRQLGTISRAINAAIDPAETWRLPR